MNMKENIKDKLLSLPHKPGVYVYYNSSGEVIYIGKAINLHSRVNSYFTGIKKHNLKTLNLVSNIANFDYFECLSEMDALAMESTLIKKHKPYYNILLKDDKQFPYIRIDLKEDYPKPEIVRKVKNDGAKYYGPYFAKIKASDIIFIINNTFKLRQCNYSFSLNKPLKRNCINYELGLCFAPCVNKISINNYRQQIQKVIDFLNGEDNYVCKKLNDELLSCVENEDFERAIKIRDCLKMISSMQEKVVTSLSSSINLDAFGYYSDGIYSSIARINIRGGKLTSFDSQNIIDIQNNEQMALEEYMIAYYNKGNLLPKEILVSSSSSFINLQKYFKEKYNISVKIFKPQKLSKRDLLNLVVNNAKTQLLKDKTITERKEMRTTEAIKLLKDTLNLKNMPNRIEGYDISHTSGENKVGSMVVFSYGEKSLKSYRKFIIKTVEGNNDFDSLVEMINRRFERLLQNDLRFGGKPDLIMIDGGNGQLHSVVNSLCQNYPEIVSKIDVVSLAEKQEEIFTTYSNTSIKLPKSNLALNLLINVRDEAHRFAINAHRNKRAKNLTHSELDDIVGVGEKTKEKLLLKFKTLSNLKKAKLVDIQSIPHIDINKARSIYNALHKIKK